MHNLISVIRAADFPISLRMNFICSGTAFFLFTVLILTGCTSAENQREPIIEMEFSVDSGLVNQTVRDSALSITYLVPAEWIELKTPDTTSSLLRQAGGIRVNKVLQKEDSSVVFSLTDIRSVPDSVFQRLNEQYKTLLNPSGQWITVDRATFMKDDFRVNQFILSNGRHTNFKLVFGQNGKSSFQVDYSVVVDSAYTLNTKTLESIIGSLDRDH